MCVLYHNPRCSKSRQTLALLEQRNLNLKVIHYLKDPPDEATLRQLLDMLGVRPLGLMRRKERLFTELSLAEHAEQDDYLIQAMCEHPILIERPIFVHRQQARIGRPPEAVLEIL